MKKYKIIAINDLIASCESDTKEKVYIFLKDLPNAVKEGDYLFQDKAGKLRIDVINSYRNRKSI